MSSQILLTIYFYSFWKSRVTILNLKGSLFTKPNAKKNLTTTVYMYWFIHDDYVAYWARKKRHKKILIKVSIWEATRLTIGRSDLLRFFYRWSNCLRRDRPTDPDIQQSASQEKDQRQEKWSYGFSNRPWQYLRLQPSGLFWRT